MSYRESRAVWRKLWRKEPARRQAELSYHARTLAVFLLRHADDSGCLGPVPERGHAAALLAQMLAIPPRNRKAFYRELEELVNHGDDGEPLALVMRDGHFYLSRFEDCQANRRDKTGPQAGRKWDKSGTEQGPSLPHKPAETLQTETDLATEVRSKKREERNSIGFEAQGRGLAKVADLLASDAPADRGPGSLAKRLYAQHFEERYGKPRSNLDRYREDFARIEELAAEQPGSLDRVLDHVFRSFFEDRSQAGWGTHSPRTLAGKGFHLHARGYAETHEAECRVQAEREHSERTLAKLEADAAQFQREQGERWAN